MTRDEKNAVSSGLLVSGRQTEFFMDFWLRMESAVLTGRSKQLWNNMTHAIRSARFYWEQFVDNTTTTLYDEDKDSKRIDMLLLDASDMARLYLTSINLSANGYSIQAVIDAMNRLIEQEENPKILVSKEVIDKFKVNI